MSVISKPDWLALYLCKLFRIHTQSSNQWDLRQCAVAEDFLLTSEQTLFLWNIYFIKFTSLVTVCWSNSWSSQPQCIGYSSRCQVFHLRMSLHCDHTLVRVLLLKHSKNVLDPVTLLQLSLDLPAHIPPNSYAPSSSYSSYCPNVTFSVRLTGVILFKIAKFPLSSATPLYFCFVHSI